MVATTKKKLSAPRTKKSSNVLNQKISIIITLLKQLHFNLWTLTKIIWYKPSHLIYYETLSALPAIVYKRLFDTKVTVICHYHELNALSNISSESRSVKFIRKIELKNYKYFDWISQTNDTRKDIFFTDYCKYLDKRKLHTLSNYPPESWNNDIDEIKTIKNQINFVLVGSVSVDKMYIREFCELLEKQSFKFTFSIYSFDVDLDTKAFIESKNYIYYNGTIEYSRIPKILKNYDVGVILYKPISINITSCVSNKLFEYHICGLDVIFPVDMEYSMRFITKNTYPQIIGIDFAKDNQLDLFSLLNKSSFSEKKINATAENEYAKLYEFLLKHRSNHL